MRSDPTRPRGRSRRSLVFVAIWLGLGLAPIGFRLGVSVFGWPVWMGFAGPVPDDFLIAVRGPEPRLLSREGFERAGVRADDAGGVFRLPGGVAALDAAGSAAIAFGDLELRPAARWPRVGETVFWQGMEVRDVGSGWARHRLRVWDEMGNAIVFVYDVRRDRVRPRRVRFEPDRGPSLLFTIVFAPVALAAAAAVAPIVPALVRVGGAVWRRAGGRGRGSTLDADA